MGEKFEKYKEDILEIPLFNDLFTTFGDSDSVNELNRMILQYKDELDLYLHFKYDKHLNVVSDESLIKYLKFVGFADIPEECDGKSVYEDVVKYINETNISKFIELFEDNVNIQNDVVPLLKFNLVETYINTEGKENIKERYIKHNIRELVFNSTYIIRDYVIAARRIVYYEVDGLIYIPDVKFTQILIMDVCEFIKEKNEHSLKLIKWLYDSKKLVENNFFIFLPDVYSTNNVEIFKYLISIGCDTSASHIVGVEISISRRYLDMLKILIENGANLDYLNNSRANYYILLDHIHEIFEECLNTNDMVLCNFFVRLTSSYVISEKLIKHVERGNEQIVKFLLENGADPHSDHNNALRTSTEKGYYTITKMLLEYGADVHVFNDEPLTNACNFKHYEIVKLLLEHDADLHINNNEPLRNSFFNKDKILFDILVEKGADVTAKNNYIKRWEEKDNRSKLSKFINNIFR